MSENQYDDLFEDDTETTEVQDQENGPRALRDALKKQSKELKELREFKAKQETEKRQSDLEDAITGAGLPPAAVELAALQVKDPADLPKWIEEKRGRFGVAAESTTEEDTTPKGNPSLTPDQIQELQATQVETQSQFQPGSREAARSRMTEAASKATSLEDLVSQINDSLSKASGG